MFEMEWFHHKGERKLNAKLIFELLIDSLNVWMAKNILNSSFY